MKENLNLFMAHKSSDDHQIVIPSHPLDHQKSPISMQKDKHVTQNPSLSTSSSSSKEKNIALPPVLPAVAAKELTSSSSSSSSTVCVAATEEEILEKEEEKEKEEISERERLKRHRVEVAGRVWIPEIWGQEELLKDWIDCTAFDAPLVPSKITIARKALVQEGTTRSPNVADLRIIDNRC